MFGRTLELLGRLVACRSVTPVSAGALELAAEVLGAAGFVCERIDAQGVGNLYAVRGEGSPSLLFAGHVDVVPPGPEKNWRAPPFVPVIRRGMLYGRGACDMKSAVAAMLAAAEDAAARIPPGRLGVLLTSDEEGSAEHGTRHAAAVLGARGIRYDSCLVGEPSCERRLGDTMRTGRRGSLTGTVVFTGVQGHAAYPQYMRNPVPALARAVAALLERKFAAEPGMEPTLFTVVRLAADGGASNVVPGTASATFNFRYRLGDDPDELRSWAERLFAHENMPFACEWQHGGEPYMTAPDSQLAAALAATCEETLGVRPRPSAGGGASDGRFLRALCAQVIEFGPVGRSMHKIDEHVRVADLGPLAQIYARLAERLCESLRG